MYPTHPLSFLHYSHPSNSPCSQAQYSTACHQLEIPRYRYHTGMTSIRRIHSPVLILSPLIDRPCACRIAYLPPQQKPMAPILLMPGIMRTVLINPPIKGLVTASQCFTVHGPIALGTTAAFLVVSTRDQFFWVGL